MTYSVSSVGASGPGAPQPASFGYADVWSSPDGATWTQVFDGRKDQANNYKNSFDTLYYLQTVENAGRIWLTCGWNWPMTGPTKTVGSSQDGATWTYYEVPFPQRFYHLSLSFGGSVWVMGGMDNKGARTFYHDVWRSP